MEMTSVPVICTCRLGPHDRWLHCVPYNVSVVFVISLKVHFLFKLFCLLLVWHISHKWWQQKNMQNTNLLEFFIDLDRGQTRAFAGVPNTCAGNSMSRPLVFEWHNQWHYFEEQWKRVFQHGNIRTHIHVWIILWSVNRLRKLSSSAAMPHCFAWH